MNNSPIILVKSKYLFISILSLIEEPNKTNRSLARRQVLELSQRQIFRHHTSDLAWAMSKRVIALKTWSSSNRSQQVYCGSVSAHNAIKVSRARGTSKADNSRQNLFDIEFYCGKVDLIWVKFPWRFTWNDSKLIVCQKNQSLAEVVCERVREFGWVDRP